jgi:predicted Zn-dependent peptidase
MIYQYNHLQNGIRSVFRQVVSPVSHIGLIISAGSRDEEPNEQGLAHFIEHTIFKGTQKRKSFHILSYLENIGGEINAYTSREETCIYASVPCEYTERTLELFSDIFNNSIFPAIEVDREKEVVLEEILYYRDLPDETILDDFEELVFPGHPLGRNILGTPKAVRSFNPKKIKNFIRKNYTANRVILSCVGGLTEESWIRFLQKHFSESQFSDIKTKRIPVGKYQVFENRIKKNTHQTHCVIGGRAYSFHEKKRLGLVLLNNILGGPGNNSRLNLAIRERNGLSYNIESNYNPYSDTGIFIVYLGSEKKNASKAIALTHKELSHLCHKKLGVLQLHRAKQQLTGQLIIAHESNLAEMLSMGKSMMIHDKVQSLEEIVREINTLNAEKLIEIANEIFDQKKLSTLIFESSKS